MSFATDRSAELTVTGTVADVEFRNWAAREATRLALGGWVRTNSDRTVTLALEGAAETIDGFIELVRRAPGVEGVDVREQPEAHGYSGFQVEY